MASPNLSEIITTTLRNRSGKLADNVTRNNAGLNRMREKGKVKPVGGGRTIVQELEYAQNATFMWYSGYQALNVAPSDVISAAEFNWRQAAVAVSISGLEQLQNSGKERVIDLLESRINNAEKTMLNGVAAAMYNDGTDPLQIGGLQFLLADSPGTGTVGGIDRNTWVFWRNIVQTGVTASTDIQAKMLALYVQLVRGTDKPDLILSDNNYYQFYVNSLTNIQRITDDKTAQAGFVNVMYMNAPVVLDGGFQGFSTDTNPSVGGMPANHMYFLNTDYIYFRPHRDRNFVPLDPGERFSVNQDAMVKLMAFAGNLTMSNARLQGVLKA
jgi:hypothetical protein